MTTKVENFADRLIGNAESVLSFFAKNGAKLWIWYVVCVLGLTLYNVVIFVSLVPLFYESFAVERLFYWEAMSNGTFIFLFLLQTVKVVVVLAMYGRMRRKESTGITLAAWSLLLSLVSGGWIVFLFGVYALINKSFREHVRLWAPDWYKQIIEMMDSINENKDKVK